jgi:hypothetical protein
MDDKNERLIRKIQALLNKTLENGASETEMMLSLKKASELMMHYNISKEEVTVTEKSSPLVSEALFRKGSREYMDQLVWAIERLCGVAIILTTQKKQGKKTRQYLLYGEEQDVLVCKYLLNHIRTFIESSTRTFKKGSYYQSLNRRLRLRAGLDFAYALTYRINQRISEIIAVQTSGLCTAAIMKNKLNQAITFASTDLGPLGKAKSGQRTYADQQAINEGLQQGDAINLNGGLNEARQKGYRRLK